MRRIALTLLTLVTLAPAVGTVAAVSTVPASAYALPTFEFSTRDGPLRITAADLGARRGERGIEIDDAKLDRAVAELHAKVSHPATPGTYELKDDSKVVMHAGAPGFELDVAATRDMLIRALRGSRSGLRLPMKEVPAPPPPGHAIVVKLQEFRLDLYAGSDLTEHFPVGVGALRFPTPPGAYYIKSKAKNPTWRNPGSRWARSMPSYIGPGPRNPLGTRALRLDRGALVIHGTPQPWTIGTRASHGCIRMKRPDVERLFDMVPEGTPVFIVP